MKKIEDYERIVNYYETDQMQVVHHSNYIRYFEEARADWMGQIGISYAEMEKYGILIPVLSVSAKYKKAVRYGQTIIIKLNMTKFNGVKADFEYEIYDKETGELCTTGNSSHGFLDKNMKPIMLKKTYPDIYKKFAQCL